MRTSAFIIALTCLLASGESAFAQQSCTGFHKKNCHSGSKEGWVYNSQSKSGLFTEGMSSEIKIVIFKDFDYSLNLCNQRDLGKGELGMTVKDAKTGEMIYDNAVDGMTQHFEFTCEATRSVIVTVVAPGGDGSDSKGKGNDQKKSSEKGTGPKSAEGSSGGCVGLLIEQMASHPTGFGAMKPEKK
jgi:hypothetical protein